MQKAALLMYAIYPFQKYKFTHYCMWDIDWKRLFQNVSITVLRIWLISQYLAAHFSHCKAMIDNMVHNSGPYLIWYALMSLASSASSSVLPLYTSTMHPYSSFFLSCWPWSFSGCSSTVRICNSCVILWLYMLSNWRFMRCTFELFQRMVYNWLILYSLH